MCRVSVTSVEECLPGLRWEEKSGIVLATHTAPTIPAGEKSRPPRVFQRHPTVESLDGLNEPAPVHCPALQGGCAQIDSDHVADPA